MAKQLECRVTITNLPNGNIKMGMYDPIQGRHIPLGTHKSQDRDKVVSGLKERIEKEGHRLTFSEVSER